MEDRIIKFLKAFSKGTKLIAEGESLYSEAEKLSLLSEGGKLSLLSEGYDLITEGHKLLSRAEKLFPEGFRVLYSPREK